MGFVRVACVCLTVLWRRCRDSPQALRTLRTAEFKPYVVFVKPRVPESRRRRRAATSPTGGEQGRVTVRMAAHRNGTAFSSLNRRLRLNIDPLSVSLSVSICLYVFSDLLSLCFSFCSLSLSLSISISLFLSLYLSLSLPLSLPLSG